MNQVADNQWEMTPVLSLKSFDDTKIGRTQPAEKSNQAVNAYRQG
jgi:hypothetical protein